MEFILLFLYGVIILLSFVLSLSRLLNCLIVVENFNVLLLFICLLSNWDETRIFFIALMVIFTIEVTLGLVVLTRLCDSSSLIDTVGV
uniref:NADH dehydrogenase subunit 4L n=1 Tax=Notocotylus intestinalis TaxID=1197314 RepID=A0A8A4JC94_9TREM|nr:NADH dehydrogenase subunit 4L [Notocotylus intestinalis]QTC30698.1 NADH dehydrogenase subunit 4L [Notocotylus intestinalis]